MIEETRTEQLKAILLAQGKEKARLVARYWWLNFISTDDETSKIYWFDEEETPSFEGLLLLAEVWIAPTLPKVSERQLESADEHFWNYMEEILKGVLYNLGGVNDTYIRSLYDEFV